MRYFLFLVISLIWSCKQPTTKTPTAEEIAKEVAKQQELNKVKEVIEMELVKLLAKGNMNEVKISDDPIYKEYYKIHEDSIRQKIEIVQKLKDKYE